MEGWPLKAKYRRSGKLLHRQGVDPPEGTWTYSGGNYRSASGGNAGKTDKSIHLRPRRRAYGPIWSAP